MAHPGILCECVSSLHGVVRRMKSCGTSEVAPRFDVWNSCLMRVVTQQRQTLLKRRCPRGGCTLSTMNHSQWLTMGLGEDAVEVAWEYTGRQRMEGRNASQGGKGYQGAGCRCERPCEGRSLCLALQGLEGAGATDRWVWDAWDLTCVWKACYLIGIPESVLLYL